MLNYAYFINEYKQVLTAMTVCNESFIIRFNSEYGAPVCVENVPNNLREYLYTLNGKGLFVSIDDKGKGIVSNILGKDTERINFEMFKPFCKLLGRPSYWIKDKYDRNKKISNYTEFIDGRKCTTPTHKNNAGWIMHFLQFFEVQYEVHHSLAKLYFKREGLEI